MRRYSNKTIRHLQRCKTAKKAKKQRRANKVAEDSARMALRKRVEGHTVTLKAAIIAIGAVAVAIHSMPKGGNVVKLPTKPKNQATPSRKAA